ncbi:hypothetical protein PVAND_015129 [Polypedilum vanderplanki]|uniref:Uncharacterized protein n=1 Tax=Polypedilum vanderplanki TaxID=319348 RepID=A0A9J6BC52_POLVA|nr:hypothetical protein PVAND_015129 [Polypedilum vanderplanki]
MSSTNKNQTPWQRLTEAQRKQLLQAKIKLDDYICTLDEVEELENYHNQEEILSALTQYQIDALFAGRVVDLDDKSSSYLELVPPPPPKGLKWDKSPYDLLNEEDQQKVLNTEIQIPGYKTKFGELIENEIKFLKKLTFDDIQNMLSGTKIVYFKDIVESLDKFVKLKGKMKSRNGSRSKNNQFSFSSSYLNQISENSSTITPQSLNKFIEELKKDKTKLITKSSINDSTLFQIYEAWKRNFINSCDEIFFYRNFHESRFTKPLEKKINESRKSIKDQFFSLYDDKLDTLEILILKKKLKDGKVFFMMDNIEYLRGTEEIYEGVLKKKLVEIIKQLKIGFEEDQYEGNKIIIVTNEREVEKREEQLKLKSFKFDTNEMKEECT